MSYVYHSMSTYFNRDNVALPGLAAYFRAQSDEERGHAQLLMDFQVSVCTDMRVFHVVCAVCMSSVTLVVVGCRNTVCVSHH